MVYNEFHNYMHPILQLSSADLHFIIHYPDDTHSLCARTHTVTYPFILKLSRTPLQYTKKSKLTIDALISILESITRVASLKKYIDAFFFTKIVTIIHTFNFIA